MGYVKVVKNRNYYKRYQVKYRRRREAKTDYALRRRLIVQDKRKYNAPKWRLVVRITNKDVICQITSARMIGDKVLCAAYAHELKRYGLKVGFTNYAACYCTGLLVARRLLKKLGMDQIYKGKKRIDGNMFKSRAENALASQAITDDRIIRPFKCVLDVGLRRTTTGARIFGALKGAVDGGLDIPHNNKRFPGFTKGKDGAKDEYDPSVHRHKIFGGHVGDYMKLLQENEPEAYAKRFSRYIASNVDPSNLEGMYRTVHANIRKDPTKSPRKPFDVEAFKEKFKKPKKLTLAERKERRNAIIAKMRQVEEKEADVEMADV